MQARLRASGLADLDAKLLAGERLTMEDGMRLFEAPDLLPSLDEIRAPDTWIARVGRAGAAA